MGEHRVEVDHLWRLAFPGAHAFDGVAIEQAHAADNRPHLLVSAGPCQAILKQRRNQRLALDQGHLATQAGQHERVLAQTCRGIQHLRPHALSNAHRLGDHLPVAATKLAPMRRLALDEVDPHRPRRLRPELLDLQAVGADLHGKCGGFIFQRQSQALGPDGSLRRIFRRQRLDSQTCAQLLLFHHNPHSKKLKTPLGSV